MSKLDNLKEQYAKLGEEIKKLEVSTVRVIAIHIPSEFDVHVALRKMNWQEAMDYAESIGMRLPTKLELQIIISSTVWFNYSGRAWSASTTDYSTRHVWAAHLSDGMVGPLTKTGIASVICVAKK